MFTNIVIKHENIPYSIHLGIITQIHENSRKFICFNTFYC